MCRLSLCCAVGHLTSLPTLWQWCRVIMWNGVHRGLACGPESYNPTTLSHFLKLFTLRSHFCHITPLWQFIDYKKYFRNKEQYCSLHSEYFQMFLVTCFFSSEQELFNNFFISPWHRQKKKHLFLSQRSPVVKWMSPYTKFRDIKELLRYDLSVSTINCNTKTMEGFTDE